MDCPKLSLVYNFAESASGLKVNGTFSLGGKLYASGAVATGTVMPTATAPKNPMLKA